ncbi:MAG: hypothetical protein Q9170_000602 [Blastenia crenularia]
MDGEQPPPMETDVILNDDPFHNKNTQRLFEAIDELRNCGANHEIGLPELVIVGDQSAGKSSLLQSLTELPFPVSDGICTRFPTRIVSRRTLSTANITKISIEPDISDGGGAFTLKETPEEKTKRFAAYAEFTRSSSDVTAADFKDAINQAKDLMGIRSTEGTTGSRNFASDILKVEISGPDRSHFSILDVPGIFQSLTKNLTDREKIGVSYMVTSYMKPEQSIIICVASGTNDLANQAAFDMASKYDPKLRRTIGVITKCDLIRQNISHVLSLAENQEKHLDHGWFVVRNRTPTEVQMDITAIERHNREKTCFDLEPWNRLSENRRGTQALKYYLANLLCRRIQEGFPSILATIRSHQTMTLHELDRLGSSRKSTEDKRTYLAELAQQLHNLNDDALKGRYYGLQNGSLKLRRMIREANDAFSLRMIHNGHRVPFQDVGDKIPTTIGHTFQTHEMRKGLNDGPDEHAWAQSIYMTGPYQQFSPEEVRLSDYTQNPFPAETNSNGSGLFGNPVPTPVSSKNAPGGAAFGKGVPAFTSTYGQNANPGQNTGFGVFDQNPTSGQITTSVSGQPSASLFDSKPTFGQNPTSLPSSKNSSGPSRYSGSTTFTPQPDNFPAPKDASAAENSVNPVPQPNGIYAWISEEIKNCRGTELQGTLNPDVLPALFHRQIANWKEIATDHFHDVTHKTAKTLQHAARTTCGDELTAEKIQTLMMRTNRVREERGLLQLHQRFDEIISRHLQTQDPIFEKNIRDARLARFKAALERYQTKRILFFQASREAEEGKTIIVRPHDVISLFDELHMSNAQNLEDEIHDTLKSYYQLALHDFIGFVTRQVVESYLSDPRGPVLFFNPLYIGSLSSEEIEDLGAEDPETVRVRVEKEETLARLNRAEQIALKYT